MLIWIVFIGIAIISYLVQANLKSKFEKYSQMPLTNGMTGKEMADLAGELRHLAASEKGDLCGKSR